VGSYAVTESGIDRVITCNCDGHGLLPELSMLVIGTHRAYHSSVAKVLLSMILIAASACSRQDAPPRANASSTSLPAGLTRVSDPSQVCMVNDQFMGKAQIPVQVDGRTYYGCCPMCKEKLEKQPAMRLARDPVTGEEVDKATAIIIQDASGKLLYFASEDTLLRYRG
jgi:YHS domain-containing protein